MSVKSGKCKAENPILTNGFVQPGQWAERMGNAVMSSRISNPTASTNSMFLLYSVISLTIILYIQQEARVHRPSTTGDLAASLSPKIITNYGRPHRELHFTMLEYMQLKWSSKRAGQCPCRYCRLYQRMYYIQNLICLIIFLCERGGGRRGVRSNKLERCRGEDELA